MSRSWKAGVAVADITPPLGVELGGYPYFERKNTGAHDPLVASVLCLEEAGKRLILIATDLFWITRGQADSIRKGVAEETGIDPSAVIITCSHTHSAPWMSVVFEASDDQPDFQTIIDEEWIASVRRACIGAVSEAVASAFDARIEVGIGRCGADEGVGGNRRDPEEGPVDDELPALVVKDLSGRVRAVWTKYALHPTILHGESTLVSADFPGGTRASLHEAFDGAVLLYSMGAAGDQSPRYFARTKDFAEAERIGAELGRALVGAVESASPLGVGRLAFTSRTVELLPRTYSPIRRIESELVGLKAEESDLVAAGAPYLDRQNANLAVLGKECELGNARRGEEYARARFARCAPFEVTVVALDRRTALVFMPGELFCDFGLSVRAASPFTRTWVSTLSNGDLPGYCVTPAAREEGGYEPGNSLLEVNAGARLAAAALELLADLFDDERHGGTDDVQ